MRPDALGSDDEIVEALEGHTNCVMLYGSCARGDAVASSDIDVLQLTDDAQQHHYTAGALSVACYTATQLESMCARGSLFALHLKVEGRIIRDADGSLQAILASYRSPVDYTELRSTVRTAAAILDVDTQVLASNTAGFTRLTLYLLRTIAMVSVIERGGPPTFSIPEIAAFLEAPELEQAFADRENPTAITNDRFDLARRLLHRLLGETVINPFGSLEALAISIEPSRPTIASLALRLLSGEATLGYGDLLLDPLQDDSL